MLSVDGDADAAVEARIRIGWNKFRQLVPLLTNRDISLIRRGRLYSSCMSDWVKKRMNMGLRAPDQEVDQRGHGKRLWKKIAKHVI